MTKFYCDGCGKEFEGYYVGDGPMSDSFRFIEGIFCNKCKARGIILKDEFIYEQEELRKKYIEKLKMWLK